MRYYTKTQIITYTFTRRKNNALYLKNTFHIRHRRIRENTSHIENDVSKVWGQAEK